MSRKGKPSADLTGALETLNDVRAALESGEIVAFAVVGLTEGDEAPRFWTAKTRRVPKMEMVGAGDALRDHLHR